jgi:predicted peptidase
MNCKLISVFCLLIAAPAAAKMPVADDFEPLVFQDNNQSLPYRLCKPAGYDPQKQYPLVLFLHGAGERGTDNQAQLRHVARTFAAKENQLKFPCFVVAPQCPSNAKWVEVNWSADSNRQPEQPSQPMALAIKLLAELQKKYSIDSKRLYVIGLSMGGFGTWDAISRYPDLFAAAVPICGGGDETRAAAIARIPVWVFHGGNDGTVKTIRSRNMVAALQKAGGQPKYTEYAGVGHGCWARAAQEPELLPWLFAQKRP